jgi:large subunit ribosomal protein L22
MKASLRSVRIAPKKANLVASMVRGMSALEAIESLKRTPKKGARILQDLLESAVANATFNDKQKPESLVIKTIVVNKAQAYHRGVPMARGRVRPIRKFLSHIDVTLGIAGGAEPEKKTVKAEAKTSSAKTAAKKSTKTPSQAVKKSAQSPGKKSEKGASSVQKKEDTAASDSASS